MKQILLCMLLLFVGLQLTAQDEKVPLKYSFGYFGEYAYHPGLTLAVDYSLKQKTSISVDRKTKGPKTSYRSIILRGELLGFNHPDNSAVFAILPQLFFRKTRAKGFYTEVGFGAGFLRTQYSAPIIEFVDGELDEYSGGSNAFAPSVGLGIGDDNWIGAQKSLGWFTKMGILYQMPYNESSAGRLYVSAGINYTFANTENK